ncbi:MAG TPA: 3-methyl-2-oxobutanoate hydroxymethyltransferase [Acidimicrobiales bacterium]|nr:3-methyl-2-oxobutanoate hydroxymethyltransferase [Acidimicrobiales bacterium]
MTTLEARPKVGVPGIAARKRRDGADPVVMITAYDTPFARIVDDAGVDLILVGDSVADNVLGYEDTLQVDVAQIAHHVAAVARARPRALVVADMPWMSYHLGPADALRNAAVLVRAGADAVKLEGGRRRLPVVQAILDAEIPVMGHLGLTPQSVHALGGLRVQARDPEAAAELLLDAKALAVAGCFALVLEGVPDAVATAATGAVDVPTIGIGAGADCDGQVLVLHDVLGLSTRPSPKFVRRYADLATIARDAVAAYAADVRSSAFPGDDETYHASPALRDSLAARGD